MVRMKNFENQYNLRVDNETNEFLRTFGNAQEYIRSLVKAEMNKRYNKPSIYELNLKWDEFIDDRNGRRIKTADSVTPTYVTYPLKLIYKDPITGEDKTLVTIGGQ